MLKLSHVLADTGYQVAMRLRLRLPAFNIIKRYCGACKLSITNDHWHYLSCANRALALYALHSSLEPSSLSDDNRLRLIYNW